MLNVLKVRIYPNQQQKIALTKNLGCARFVWNYYLNKTNNQYQETGFGMTYCQMAKDLTSTEKNPLIINGYKNQPQPLYNKP